MPKYSSVDLACSSVVLLILVIVALPSAVILQLDGVTVIKFGLTVTLMGDEKLSVKLLNKNGIKTIISKEKMHLKVAVIDSKIAILGSTNWTEESFEENYDFIYITNEEKIINSLLDFINSFN